jgi:hypothetical protein
MTIIDAEYIGKPGDGSQFFLSNAFEPAICGKSRRQFAALFIFYKNTTSVEDRIDDAGIFGEVIQAAVLSGSKILSNRIINGKMKQRFAGLGGFRFDDIQIEPFEIGHSGIQPGSIPLALEEEDENWRVEFYPGNVMATYPHGMANTIHNHKI